MISDGLDKIFSIRFLKRIVKLRIIKRNGPNVYVINSYPYRIIGKITKPSFSSLVNLRRISVKTSLAKFVGQSIDIHCSPFVRSALLPTLAVYRHSASNGTSEGKES